MALALRGSHHYKNSRPPNNGHLQVSPTTDRTIPLIEKVDSWMRESDLTAHEGLSFVTTSESDNPITTSDLQHTDKARHHQQTRDKPFTVSKMYTYRPSTNPNAWREWPEVSIAISYLPRDITVQEVYHLFSTHGRIVKIDINYDREGRTEVPIIVFSPPPTEAFWTQSNFQKTVRDQRTHVGARLRDRTQFTHRSPTNPQKEYPDRLILQADSLSLGFMHTETSMMEMLKLLPVEKDHPSVVVNLQKKALELTFSLMGPGGNRHHYLFRVPFTKLHLIHEQTTENLERIMVIPVEAPPEAYERTSNVDTSFNNRQHWSEWRTWYRQTNILSNVKLTALNAIGLHNHNAIIDVGRWTTYRLSLSDTLANGQIYGDFRRVLIDYNVIIAPPTKPLTFVPRRDTELTKSFIFEGGQAQPSNKLSAIQEMTNAVPSLPFDVQYQLDVCMSQEIIHPQNLTLDFLQKLSKLVPTRAVALLEQIAGSRKRIFDPMDILGEASSVSRNARAIPTSCVLMRSATITPTNVYFATPLVEISNRVIRRFQSLEDRFLRVKFTDELGSGRINSVEDGLSNEIFARIERALKQGIMIGNRKYDFLAFGNSQFREHGAYFFSASGDIDAEHIRAYLGDLERMEGTKSVARWCARLGQNFSTTRAVQTGIIEIDDQLSDIVRCDQHGNEYNFTDGVGKISPLLATMIGSEFGAADATLDPPSVFQFRMGGCKGIFVLDPELKGKTVAIRRSQYKFPAALMALEVIRISQFASATTNRQLIIILSNLGVRDEVFVNKLLEQVEELNTALVDGDKASELLQKHVDVNHFSLRLARMIQAGFMETNGPFVKSLLQLWRTWSIKYLKDKAKLFIDDGASVLGCADEYGVLKGHFNVFQNKTEASQEEKERFLPEIFLQVDDREHGGYKIIEGLCVLCRNPSLHPGDVRIVRAVNKPQLRHIRNAVVLPTTGDRDLANMCSGGDLDGDEFLVFWDKDMIPPSPEWNKIPMDFSPPKAKYENRKVTAHDMADFFVSYIKNDRLPTIAVAHLAHADHTPEGTSSRACLDLAELHSIAVDYPKSGIAVEMPQDRKPHFWPHFMERKHISKQRIYHSRKILGQLYDIVKRVHFEPQQTANFDPRILEACEASPELLEEAAKQKESYDADIRRIMAQHDIKTEFEVFSAYVLSHNIEKKDYTIGTELGHTMHLLQTKYRGICEAKMAQFSKEDVTSRDHRIPFVVAMYRVTARQMQAAIDAHEENYAGVRDLGGIVPPLLNMPPISFPWIFDDILVFIVSGSDKLVPIAQPASRKVKMTHVANGSPIVLETAAGRFTEGDQLVLFDDIEDRRKAVKVNNDEDDTFANMADARDFYAPQVCQATARKYVVPDYPGQVPSEADEVEMEGPTSAEIFVPGEGFSDGTIELISLDPKRYPHVVPFADPDVVEKVKLTNDREEIFADRMRLVG